MTHNRLFFNEDQTFMVSILYPTEHEKTKTIIATGYTVGWLVYNYAQQFTRSLFPCGCMKSTRFLSFREYREHTSPKSGVVLWHKVIFRKWSTGGLLQGTH